MSEYNKIMGEFSNLTNIRVLERLGVSEDKIEEVKRLLNNTIGEYVDLSLQDPEYIKELIVRGASSDVEVKRKRLFGTPVDKINAIDKRNIFNLFVGGVRPADIAKIYGIRSVKTVYNYIHEFTPDSKFNKVSKYSMMSDEERKKFRDAYSSGMNINEMKTMFNMSDAAIYKTAKKLGLKGGRVRRYKKREWVDRGKGKNKSNVVWVKPEELLGENK